MFRREFKIALDRAKEASAKVRLLFLSSGSIKLLRYSILVP